MISTYLHLNKNKTIHSVLQKKHIFFKHILVKVKTQKLFPKLLSDPVVSWEPHGVFLPINSINIASISSEPWYKISATGDSELRGLMDFSQRNYRTEQLMLLERLFRTTHTHTHTLWCRLWQMSQWSAAGEAAANLASSCLSRSGRPRLLTAMLLIIVFSSRCTSCQRHPFTNTPRTRLPAEETEKLKQLHRHLLLIGSLFFKCDCRNDISIAAVLLIGSESVKSVRFKRIQRKENVQLQPFL